MLVFFTAVRCFNGHFVGGQLTFPHCSRANLLGSLPVSLVHIISPVTDNYHFLNQRERDNGRRNCFMTILLLRMCAVREDGIRDRPHTRRTRVRPSYHALQRNLRVVHAAERLALPRSMSSVRYSLEAIFKCRTQTASRCIESYIIIQQSS